MSAILGYCLLLIFLFDSPKAVTNKLLVRLRLLVLACLLISFSHSALKIRLQIGEKQDCVCLWPQEMTIIDTLMTQNGRRNGSFLLLQP